jgi:hypothetical protein
LVPHLDDHLVTVDGVRFAENGSACLAVLRARDPEKTPLYVLVTSEGDVRLGRVDALATSITRRLDDFDPLRQGVMTVAVTGQQRFQGDRLDLWIMVRRSSDLTVTAYHGVLGLEDGGLVLEPARDDRRSPEGGRWEAGDASRLPEWLYTWSFVCPPEADPFEALPEAALAEIREAEASPTGDIEIVAYSRAALGIAVGGEIWLWHSGGSEPRRLVIGDWVRALAVSDDADDAGGRSRGVVGPDALHLIALDLTSGAPAVVWRQKVREFPVAVAFLPPDGSPVAPEAWPELLVAFHDGELQSLRQVGNRSFREAWNGLWKCLGLTTAKKRIKTALGARDWEDQRRRAAILGAVEQALQEAGKAQPEVRQVWIEQIGVLFRPEERSRVLMGALDLLLDDLRSFIRGERAPWPVPDGRDFTVALIYKIYTAKSYIAIQDHIDQAFRVLPLTEIHLQDSFLEELHRRATHNRRAVWQEGEPDPEDREALIRRSVFGMERWANACLQSDAVLLGEPPESNVLAGLAGFVHRSGKPEWLVVGQGQTLWAHRVTAKATLQINAGGMCELEHDPVRAMAQVPGAEPGRLLVACASGRLVLVAVDTMTGSLERLDELSIDDLGSPWALTCSQAGRQGPIAAVSYNEHRRSTVVLCSLAGDRLRETARIPLDLPRVRSLDLAEDGDGELLLAAGAVHAAPVYVYRLDLTGRIAEARPFRVLKSGTLAVRFSSPQRPEFLLAGERNGFLWCCVLMERSKLAELCWTHDLGGAVRTIEVVEEAGEPAFLIGTEHGRLVLLRARDGRRLWKHQLHEPVRLIRQIAGPQGKEIALALSGGWVVILERILDRREVLEKIEGYLGTLDRATIDSAESSLPEPAQALSRLVRSGRGFLSVLEKVPVREVRARLIRYLAEEIGPRGLGSDIVETLRALSLRELQLLLSYLPDSVTDWDAAIEAELRRRHPSKPLGDESWGAGMAAWATCLQRFGRRSPDLAAVRAFCPPPEYLERPWVRLEYARLLLQRTAAAEGIVEEGSPGRLLRAVLGSLFDMPFSLIGACAEVLRFDSPDARDFRRLRTLTDDLLRGSGPRIEDVQGLADSLLASGAQEGLLRLLAAIVDLLAICLREGQQKQWQEWRALALAGLRRVAEGIPEIKRSDPALGGLVARLRQCLPSDLPPHDREPLKERMSWLQQARQRLDQENAPAPDEGGNPWALIEHKLADLLKIVFIDMIRLETGFVLYLVRPYLKPLEVELGEGRRLVLHLVAEPEGSRQLTDVSILFKADGEDGLLPPGKREDRFDGLSYPEKTATKELLLTGFVRPDQEKVTVRVTLRDEGQYRFEESWFFAVPKGLDRVRHRFSFQDHLPHAFESFMAGVLAAKAPVVLAVLDEYFGRDTFVERWLARTRGRRVNLDELVKDIGAGRRYSARSLDLELLTGLDAPAQGNVGGLAERPLLVAPVDELLQRLLDGEAKGLLETWLTWLRQRASARELPQYVIVVSSVHACELRALGLGEIAEVAAHRVLLESPGTSRLSASQLVGDLLDLVGKEADLHPEEARERVEALGWDLRLVMRWLRWLREEPGREKRPLSNFLADPRTRKLLELELKALAPFELINVLVGAETVTVLDLSQVKPGQFAASDYQSTTRRSAPKLLQQEGTAFTENSLSSLRSDLQPPNKVRLQGLGLLGSVESSSRTGLLSISSHFRRDQREVILRQLAKRGLGSYIHPIFRTGSPYRDLVRVLYDAGSRTGAKQDAHVYTYLKGRDRSPLESLSILELSRISQDELKNLLPDTETRELQRLRRIGRLWDPASTDDVDSAITSLFQPETVSKLTPAKGRASRWDEPFAGLAWPVFAVGKSREENGENDPEDYFVWSASNRSVDLGAVGDAADQVIQLWQAKNADRESASTPRRAPKVTILGPGVDALAYDETRRVAILRSSDLCQAAWEGKMIAGMRRKARSQMRLTALSPFQTSGALRPGSRLFVGREKELSFIKTRIRAASILIIGSRRVGKTSLLNQIDGWAQTENDLAPIYVDLQGCTSEADFMDRLRRSVASSAIPATSANDLDSLVDAIRKAGKLPIFLLNEVDALVEKEKSFVASWRGLNDRQRARFLMVGYSAIGSLGIPDAPFFHFTEGPDFAGKALVLTALSPDAAEKLLDLLETTELLIHWASREDRERAYRLCLDRSYRIPWVLQRYGQLLVEHLEKERRDTLSYQDVESVVERQGRVVWQYIDGIDYQSLGGGVSNAQRPGFQLVLAAVARRRYFLGGKDAPIRDPRLPDRAALGQDLGFTVGEAREIVKETLRQLLVGRERAIVEGWFNELDLEKAFRLLTLTLMLEPDPGQDGRYGFLLHILPRELLRINEKDSTLDALIVRNAIEFMNFIDKNEENTDGRSRAVD